MGRILLIALWALLLALSWERSSSLVPAPRAGGSAPGWGSPRTQRSHRQGLEDVLGDGSRGEIEDAVEHTLSDIERSQGELRKAPRSESRQDRRRRLRLLRRMGHATTKLKTMVSISSRASARKRTQRVVRSVEELRHCLDELQLPLERVVAQGDDVPVEQLRQHSVAQALRERRERRCKPGARDAADKMRIGLAIEGGGMRGAYAAGASTALLHMGYADAFDEVLGCSAGSVIASYFVSRQLDAWKVYCDTITKPEDRFIDLRLLPVAMGVGDVVPGVGAFKERARLGRAVDADGLPFAKDRAPLLPDYSHFSPVFNLNQLLGAMEEDGELPLDWTTFKANDRVQPLKVIATASRSLESVALSREGGHWAEDSLSGVLRACRASATVPGIAGPAVRIPRDGDGGARERLEAAEPLSDGLLLEAVPYRSAIKGGCTHVLVLRSRPLACQALGKGAGIFERYIANRFFRAEGCEAAAKFIRGCGHQVLYAEDTLLIADASAKGGPRAVPGDGSGRKAELLGIAPGAHVDEISQFETGRANVVQSVREGFVAAYCALAPLEGEGSDEERAARVRAQAERLAAERIK